MAQAPGVDSNMMAGVYENSGGPSTAPTSADTNTNADFKETVQEVADRMNFDDNSGAGVLT